MTLTILGSLLLALAPQAGNQVNPRVSIVVENRGTMVAELFPNEAPKTVARFIQLAKSGFYDGVRFHRVENEPRPFIIVAGDPLTKSLPITDPKVGTGGTGTRVPFEKNNVQFLNGTLGLVRDVRDKDSGDCQFFICNGDQRFLEHSYVGFGRVIQGLEVIPKVQVGDKITSIRIVN